MPLLTHIGDLALWEQTTCSPVTFLPRSAQQGTRRWGGGGSPEDDRESTRRETCVSESPVRQSLAELCGEGAGGSEGRDLGGRGRSEREAGASGESPRSPAHLFIALSPSRRQPGPPLGASSSAPNRPESSGIFFSFPLEIGFGVSPALSPPPHNSSPLFFSSFFFFLRHGPGSGSWKRNKCGKRERKSELNDRMQAT